MIITMGMLAAIVLPFFNIPLMIRIRKQKSSNDISLVWLYGVFTSLLLMLPSAITSKDLTFKLFGILNVVFFSGVVYHVVKYRKWGKRDSLSN